MPVATVGDGVTLNDVALAPVKSAGRWIGAAGLATRVDEQRAAAIAGLTRADVIVFVAQSDSISRARIIATTLDTATTGALLEEPLRAFAPDSLEGAPAPNTASSDRSVPVASQRGRASAHRGRGAQRTRGQHRARPRPRRGDGSVLPALRRLALLSAGGGAALALVLGAVSPRGIARPVRALAGAADALARGDFGAPLPSVPPPCARWRSVAERVRRHALRAGGAHRRSCATPTRLLDDRKRASPRCRPSCPARAAGRDGAARHAARARDPQPGREPAQLPGADPPPPGRRPRGARVRRPRHRRAAAHARAGRADARPEPPARPRRGRAATPPRWRATWRRCSPAGRRPSRRRDLVVRDWTTPAASAPSPPTRSSRCSSTWRRTRRDAISGGPRRWRSSGAAPGGGTIASSARRESASRCSTTGPGIPPDDPAARSSTRSSPPSRTTRGVGLGLFVAEGLVRAAGGGYGGAGRTRRPGRRRLLPHRACRRGDAAPVRPSTAERDEARGREASRRRRDRAQPRGARLLLVDDDRAFRLSTAALLRPTGTRCTTAGDGPEAVAALAAARSAST